MSSFCNYESKGDLIMFNYASHTRTYEVVGVKGILSEKSNTVLTLKGPITHTHTHTIPHNLIDIF